MASAGMGDVLTGAIAGLVAQGLPDHWRPSWGSTPWPGGRYRHGGAGWPRYPGRRCSESPARRCRASEAGCVTTSGIDSVVTAAAFTEGVPHVKILCTVRPAILFTMLLTAPGLKRVSPPLALWWSGCPSRRHKKPIWLEYKDDKGAAGDALPVKVAGKKAAVDLAPLREASSPIPWW